MITVNCSQCKAQLEMDDAFAGGVCRCHYCGTIQTVPAAAKRVGIAAATPVAAGPVSAARGHSASAEKTPEGLDALAQAVASSSQSRAGMRVDLPPAAAAPPMMSYAHPTRQKTLTVPLIIALGIIFLLLSAVMFMLFSQNRMVGTATVTTPPVYRGSPRTPRVPPAPNNRDPDPGETAVAPPPGDAPEPDVPRGPQFCGVDLTGVPSVAYVLDRGQASAELFDTLKEATYRSIESLKTGQKFQIIFWDNGGEAAAYPADGFADVSAQEIEAARAQFADVIAGGRTSPDAAIRRAAQGRPGAIVLVTGKAFDLDEELLKTVHTAVKGTSIKIHTIALKTDDGNPVLKQIADQTHAQFRVVSGPELRKFSY